MFTKQVSPPVDGLIPPIVAAEVEQVERTRRRTWSRDRSEVLCPSRWPGHRSLDSPLCSGRPADHNGRVQVKVLASRTLGLFGRVLAEDADQLLEATASVGPGGPISLNLTGVTSIDEGGIAAIRLAARSAHDFGGVLILLLPPTDTLDQVRGAGLDEEPLILVEVLET
jgi:hypothetical protein